ncbi:hypothetical protein ACFC4L_30755, partial [Streptomyces sp. NPDC055929]
MQRLLRYGRWDADAVRGDVRAYAVEHLGADDAVLIVDDTGFIKKRGPCGRSPAHGRGSGRPNRPGDRRSPGRPTPS